MAKQWRASPLGGGRMKREIKSLMKLLLDELGCDTILIQIVVVLLALLLMFVVIQQ